MKHKFLSVLLCFCMVLTMIPAALAEELQGDVPQVDPVAGLLESAQLGTVVQLTPTADIQNEDFTVGEQTVPGIKVSIVPNADVPYAAAKPGYHEAGWWVGAKLQAPTTVTTASNSVQFRSTNNGTDRNWVSPTIDGGTGAEGDPLYMEAWVGYAESWLTLSPLPNGSSVRWYFNWDGSDSTGSTIPASEFKDPATGGALAGAAAMAGVDQIIEVTFMAADAQPLKFADGTQAYPALPMVETKTENGVQTVAKETMTNVINAAKEDTAGGKTATVVATAASNAATVVALDKDVFSAANTAGVSLAVQAGEVATVTLGSDALTKVNEAAAAGSVSISVQNVSSTTTSKPADTVGATAASYEVEVKVGSDKIEGTAGWGTNANIKLTVPKPQSVTDVNKLKVYLGAELAENATVAENNGKLDITVPHLTVVNLVEPASEEIVGGTITVSTAEQLTAALSNSEVTTIKLGADIDATAATDKSNNPGGNAGASFLVTRAVTLDLNSHTLTHTLASDGGYTLAVNGDSAALTIIDSVGGGRITNGTNTASTIEVVKGSLVIGDGTHDNFTIANGTKTINENSIIKVEETATKVTINGGTIDKSGKDTFRSIQTFAPVEINGGTIEATVQSWSYVSGEDTYKGSLTINGGHLKGDVTVNTNSTATFPLSGEITVPATSTAVIDGDVRTVGDAPTGTASAAKITVSGGSFKKEVNSEYLAEGLTYQAKGSDNLYSYHKTQAEATAAAGEGGEVKVVTSNGWVEIAAVGCTYTEVEGKPVGDGNPNHVYYENSMFGGKLTLSDLNDGTKYVLQLAKTGSYNAENCTIVVFTASGTTHEVEVLKSAQGYTVSLYMFTDNAGTDIRSVVKTSLDKTNITKS